MHNRQFIDQLLNNELCKGEGERKSCDDETLEESGPRSTNASSTTVPGTST